MTPQSNLIMSAAFSPIMSVGALVLPEVTKGIMEASTTRNPWTPRTLETKDTSSFIQENVKRKIIEMSIPCLEGKKKQKEKHY